MVELIYRALLRLHPAAFRDRFGGEMMSIFENSGEKSTVYHGRLIVDAALSFVRQWLLRADFRTEPAPATGGTMFLVLPEWREWRSRYHRVP
jgi:hypothetical protein